MSTDDDTTKPPKGSQTTSSTQGEQSNASKKRWQKPKTIKDFAAQANDVATRVLNGEIDMEEARTYAALARVVVQSSSIQVTRARFLRETPDLSLETTEDE